MTNLIILLIIIFGYFIGYLFSVFLFWILMYLLNAGGVTFDFNVWIGGAILFILFRIFK